MLLSEVGYARPASVDDAVRLLAENDGARPLAGGQTLLNVMKARAAAPDVLVDLADLDDLRTISRRSDGYQHGWHPQSGTNGRLPQPGPSASSEASFLPTPSGTGTLMAS